MRASNRGPAASLPTPPCIASAGVFCNAIRTFFADILERSLCRKMVRIGPRKDSNIFGDTAGMMKKSKGYYDIFVVEEATFYLKVFADLCLLNSDSVSISMRRRGP